MRGIGLRGRRRGNSRPSERCSATAGLPFDDAELESRLVWIWGSPRTGSTWLLRQLCPPGERALVLLGARACARRLCALIVDGPEGETVAAAAREAGFAHLEAVRPPGGERRYVLGERVSVLARGGEPA